MGVGCGEIWLMEIIVSHPIKYVHICVNCHIKESLTIVRLTYLCIYVKESIIVKYCVQILKLNLNYNCFNCKFLVVKLQTYIFTLTFDCASPQSHSLSLLMGKPVIS